MCETCYHCMKQLGQNAERTVVFLQPAKGMRKVKIGEMCDECEDAGMAPVVRSTTVSHKKMKCYGVALNGIVEVLK